MFLLCQVQKNSESNFYFLRKKVVFSTEEQMIRSKNHIIFLLYTAANVLINERVGIYVPVDWQIYARQGKC